MIPGAANLNSQHVLMTFQPHVKCHQRRHLHTISTIILPRFLVANVTFFFLSHRFSGKNFWRIFGKCVALKTSNFENILLQKRPKKRLGNYPLQKTVKNRETSELECLFFVDEKRRPKGKGTREFVIRVFEIHPEKFFFLQILEKWPKWDLFGDIFHALCWWWKKKNGEWHLFSRILVLMLSLEWRVFWHMPENNVWNALLVIT